MALRQSALVSGPRRLDIHRVAACRPGPTGRGRLVLVCDSKAKFFVGGNWKANGTHDTIAKLVTELNAGVNEANPRHVDVVVTPTYVHLGLVKHGLDNIYRVGAQNVWYKGQGAYTGEIPAEILTDMGIEWTITGHSERRGLCGETSEMVADKTAHALECGMSVIPCIGETIDQRNSGQLFKVLEGQVQALVDKVSDWSRIVLAYEPVWAIGTGVVATPEQAQEVHAFLRKLLTDKLGRETASTLRIIYGGSVSDSNCDELASQPDIDGFLVGGASLKGGVFLKIVASHKAKVAVRA